jgi:hypothetical protein
MSEQEECCDKPRGFVGGVCDYCGGTVQPDYVEPLNPYTGRISVSAVMQNIKNGYTTFTFPKDGGNTISPLNKPKGKQA